MKIKLTNEMKTPYFEYDDFCKEFKNYMDERSIDKVTLFSLSLFFIESMQLEALKDMFDKNK